SNQISVGHVGAVCLGVCVNRSDSKYEYQIRRGLGLKLAHHTLNAFIYALFCNLMYTHTHTHTQTHTHATPPPLSLSLSLSLPFEFSSLCLSKEHPPLPPGVCVCVCVCVC